MSRNDRKEKKEESYCPNALMTYCLMTKRKDGKMEKRRSVSISTGGGGACLTRKIRNFVHYFPMSC